MATKKAAKKSGGKKATVSLPKVGGEKFVRLDRETKITRKPGGKGKS